MAEEIDQKLADLVCPSLQSIADGLVIRRNGDLACLCPEKAMGEAFNMLDDKLAEEIMKRGA